MITPICMPLIPYLGGPVAVPEGTAARLGGAVGFSSAWSCFYKSFRMASALGNYIGAALHGLKIGKGGCYTNVLLLFDY